MSLSHSPRIVTDGLIVCLDASDPKSYSGSGATWYSRTSGNNFGLYTPTYTVNPVGAIVLLYDPWNPFYSLKTWADMGFGNEFTLSCWVSSTAANLACYYGAILFASESYTVKGFRSAISSWGSIQFWAAESGGTFGTQSGGVFTFNGKKQLITLSYDGTTGKIYHNDVLVASAVGTLVPPSDLGVANWFGGCYGAWDAELHNILGYNRAITLEEVAHNYHEQKPKYQR